jgi:hypothetical protein
MTFSYEPRPPPEASGYFAAKKLRPAFRWGEVWREEHANAFTIAKMTQLDLLATVQASLQEALDKGTPYEAWAKSITPTLQKAGWWGKKEVINPATGKSELVQLGSPRRLKLIYQANMASARAAGQWERAQRTKGVAPYFLYVRSSSVDPRDEHLTWVGTLLPVDHPWWAAHFPPNGWRCKCQVRQVTQREFDRLGGERKPAVFPPVAYRRRLDDGTKAPPVMVPGGIDPGWDTSPGLARTTTIIDAFARSLARARAVGVPEGIVRTVADGRKFKTPDETWAWIGDRLAGEPFAKGEATIATVPIGPTFEAQALESGVDVRGRAHGLNESYVRHLDLAHGDKSEVGRGQLPVTAEDILAIPNLLETGQTRIAADQKRAKGKVRLETAAEKDGVLYTIITQIGKWVVFPVTVWKSEK